MAIKVAPKQAMSMIAKYIRAGLVPALRGSPGMGKSDIIRYVAQMYNLLVIDFRLSQCDPTDLLGFPQIQGNKASYVPMATFPLEGDPLPINPETGKQYDGWLIFFDEFNSCLPAVQAAMYKIVLDRMVGTNKLHSRVAMAMAGNLDTDGAITHEISTALQSRIVWMELQIDYKQWIDWANANGIDHRITDYIDAEPGSLYTFDPDHHDETYACGRTWAFASKVLGITEEDDPDRLPMLAGAITEGMANQFLIYCQIYNDLPKVEVIERNPDSIAIPNEPSILYALTGTISHKITETSAPALIKFVRRLPHEFQVVCMRSIVRRHKKLRDQKDIMKWVAESADDLFD